MSRRPDWLGDKPRAQLDDVPDNLRFRPDGTTLLQLHTEDMHIYYSQEIVTKAVNNGLLALVADGVHKLNPRTERRAPERMEEGQLYTIHGVYRGGFEVPLLFAVTRNKSEDDYVTIFGKMKEAVQAVPSDTPNTEPQLRIVVDFKMAAINAARAVFPLSSTEGCAWHLTQAWVRNRNRLGLLRFLKGGERDPRVVHWWKTLKGLPFLPRDHFHLVNALTVVPVEHSHPAYEPCQNFLDYFNRTWMRGPFESMWCKYLVKELRTTNLAENFHGRLRGLFSGKKHPKFDELITMLQEITAAAASRMNRMVEVCSLPPRGEPHSRSW